MRRQAPSKLFTTAAVVVLLAACSGDSDEQATTPSEQATSTVTPSQPDATTPDASEGEDTTAPESMATTALEGTATTSEEASPSADSDVADAVTALQTAAAEVSNGQPFDMERDTYQGGDVWEVKVASDGDEYKILVSIDGEDVVDSEQKDSPDDDVAMVEQADVDAVTALQTAADSQSGELDEMEIDTTDDGTLRWEVEFRQEDGIEVEISVDAMSGDIIN